MRSTRSARSSDAASCAPPSTSTRVSPRSAERCQRLRRGRRRPRRPATSISVDAGIGEGAPPVGDRRRRGSASRSGLRARWRPAWRSAACADGCRRRRAPPAWAGSPARRQVSSGSSASTVPTPTITASCRPRSACAARRAASPVIQRLSPRCVAIRPSSVEASFSVTSGRPRRHASAKPGRRLRRPRPQHALVDRDAGRAQPGDARRRPPAGRDRAWRSPRGRRRRRSARRCRAGCGPSGSMAPA